jgi:nucleoside 2-deoxyribosyltransferase
LNSPKSVYLAHPFAKKEYGKEIQSRLENLGIEVINPFERGEQAIYDKKLSPNGGGLDDQDCADIVKMDLEKIDKAGAVVALLLGVPSIGTMMEIFYAGHVKGYPVYALAPDEWQRKHPWIRFYSKAVVSTEQELYDDIG